MISHKTTSECNVYICMSMYFIIALPYLLTYLFISLTADNDFQKQKMSTINSHNVDKTMEKYNIIQ